MGVSGLTNVGPYPTHNYRHYLIIDSTKTIELLNGPCYISFLDRTFSCPYLETLPDVHIYIPFKVLVVHKRLKIVFPGVFALHAAGSPRFPFLQSIEEYLHEIPLVSFGGRWVEVGILVEEDTFPNVARMPRSFTVLPGIGASAASNCVSHDD
jgi:hypothetical protein